MDFNGFNESDFNTFFIEGLDERMEAIRGRIQPKFRAIGEQLSGDLAAVSGNEMFLHIAKHARRTVNPPKDTWLAICHDKRGYKKHPHFQVGLFDDHVFVWLAFIYELPNKKEIAMNFLQNFSSFSESIPDNYVISLDHTKKDSDEVSNLSNDELKVMLERFRDVKKAEFLVGRHFTKNDPILKDGERFLQETRETFKTLLPLYKMAFE
ncbi:YktB family protein [Anaerobacillus sp. MEB173]|uniref:YktB family protein n=1 Tax=Anaerobacillus sp. MEB173 TaxID=3383345 RepID=UPI003F9171DF